MKSKFIFACAFCLAALTLTSCSSDDDGGNNGGGHTPNPGTANRMILEGKIGDGDGDKIYGNIVYVDLSNKSQKLVERKSWHLGFSTGDASHVILNQSYTRAYTSHKTDFAAVTLADTAQAPNLAGGMMDFPNPKEVQIIDDTACDLNKTVFGKIENQESKSEVFFVASDNMKKRSDWFKVKVTATNDGYKVAYGKVGDQTAKTIEIAKNPAYTFVGFSLETGKVVKLPRTGEWDLKWSNAMAWTTMPNGKVILGPSSDVVTTNRYDGVETAEVMVEEVCKYKEFTKADLSKVNFEKRADVLGTDWRTAPMPNATPGPKADRFYVIRDVDGECYKLRFLHFCEQDGGERGRPELEFELLK